MITHPGLSTINRCTIPNSCIIRQFTNLYDCHLGEEVSVGPFVEIGGAEIGDRTIISSHSYICPGVRIGSDCFVAHGVMFTNDTFSHPRTYDHISQMRGEWVRRETEVGNCVRIGSGAVILCGIKIGNNAIIAAGAVVTRDVAAGETVIGVPAKPSVN